MKYILFIVVSFISFGYVSAQESGVWTVFYDETSGKAGYKDENGNIQIPLCFEGYVHANQFGNIIAVSDSSEKYFSHYYLLKNGKKVGVDSTYVFDTTFDCESEEKIRFRDPVTGNTGFFDKNGKVIIPAVYSNALPFRNGLALVLKGAEKTCFSFEKEKYNKEKPCENWFYDGGETFLINEKNEVIIKNFNIQDFSVGLDWSSLLIENDPSDSVVRDSFKGVNGKYYTFINLDKEFKNWYTTVFLKSIENSNFSNFCFETIAVTYRSGIEGELLLEKKEFLSKKSKKQILKKVKEINGAKFEYFVSEGSLSPFDSDTALFDHYFDYCGNLIEWKYPVQSVVVDRDGKKGEHFQEHFDFLRTEKGYKLISTTLRTEKLK